MSRSGQDRPADRGRVFDLVEGRVDAAATDPTAGLDVVITVAGERSLLRGVIGWRARGTLLPKEGDLVLLGFPRSRRAWVVEWWPYA